MLTSDEQTQPTQMLSGSWQVKTREGVYYQPESLAVLYQWVCENRLCADDSIFSAPSGDWIPIINMPELKNCFWQLLTSGNVIYGPVSLGEMKQLYVNNQITSSDKVTISGKGNWIQIKEIPALNDWLASVEPPAIDYAQFIDGLEKEFESSRHALKEEKISKKLRIVEQQNKENIKYIKELEKTKKELEEELINKKKELEEILSGKGDLSVKFQSTQEELERLRSELKEKMTFIEELNKHIAQAEVTNTLKGDEIGQLRSSVTSLQEELERSRSENAQLRQSLPEAARGLEKTINELQDIIFEKQKLLDESNNKIGELIDRNKELDEKVNSLQGIISEKDRIIEETDREGSIYVQQLKMDIGAKGKELGDLGKLILEKNEEIERYRQDIDRLQDELMDKDRIIEETMAGIENTETITRSREEEISNLQNQISEREAEVLGYRDSITKLQCELAERDRELAGARDMEIRVSELASEIDGYSRKIEDLSGVLEDKENERQNLINEISEIKKQYEESLSAGDDRFRDEIKVREDAINELRQNLDSIQEEYKAKIKEWEEDIAIQKAQFNNELTEKTKLWEETLGGEKEKWEKTQQDLEGSIAQRDARIEGQKLEIERLQDALISQDKQWKERSESEKEEVKQLYRELEREKNNLQVGLTRQIQEISAQKDTLQVRLTELESICKEITKDKDNLEEEYKAKIKEWEEAIAIQKAQSQEELAEKTKIWEDAFRDEKEKWEKTQQDLEGSIAQRDAQIEGQKLEIERLQDALISQDKQWKERIRVAKEESDRLYREMEKQREDLRIELTQKVNELITERDILRERLADIEREHGGIIQRQDALQKELLDREKFIEEIKAEAHRQEESHKIQIEDMEQRLHQANGEINGLQNKVLGLTNQLQNELDIQEGLRRDISIINEDLNNTRQIVEQLEREKDALVSELAKNKEEFTGIKSQLERELEDVKRNLEHAEEENRSIQKQFYLEKQKLTKEYTETINKQEKLKKREQLEREIQDRVRTKEEIERLYNLLKENLEGIQRGAAEIQSSLQNLSGDIDNKRLSLKYLTETEKRDGKKGQLPNKTELAEGSDISS